MVYGKVPPQAKDLEEAILGIIMLEPYKIDQAMELLTPECFYMDAHQRIFQVFTELTQKSIKIDLMVVVQALREKDELEMVGGPYFVTKLTNAVVSSANLDPWCRIIMQQFIKREIIRIGGTMMQDGYEDSTDVFDLLEQVEEEVYGISLKHIKKDYSTLSAGLMEVVKRIEESRHHDDTLTGVPSGFPSIDRLTNGWQPSDLIILAARPSVGKTAFALNLARNAATIKSPRTGKVTPTAVFSLEMSRNQLVQRILSAQSEIHLKRIKTGRFDDDQMKALYNKGIQKLADVPIFIDDTAGLTMFELRAKCRRMISKHGIGLILIDYLQLMSGQSGKNSNREQEISQISRELKKLAKDLEVPIIALSQLSREVEKRGKGQKIPQLSDLRESGAIEQDADLVAFIYRPPADEVAEDAALRNRGMIKIAKHRDGELDEIILSFYGEIQKWMELDEGQRYEAGMDNAWIPVPTTPPGQSYSEPTKKNSNVDEDLPF